MRNILQYVRVYRKLFIPRNSKQLVRARSNRIRRLIEDNKSDNQIIKDLDINNHAHYTYKSRIHMEDAQIWDKIH